MESLPETTNPTETCSGCSKPSAPLTLCNGGRLCEKCRSVIQAAVVLLNRGIGDEATIIPTLVLAKVAGGSPGYTALVEEELPAVDIPKLMHVASGRSIDSAKDEYAGWEFVEVLGGVPIARVRPVALKLEDYASTSVLKQVEIQVISRHVKPETVGGYYEQVLGERGANWRGNNHGRISYSFSHGFLSMCVSSGDDVDPQAVRTFGNDFFRHPAFHFPAPGLVADIYGSLLGSVDSRNRQGFAYALDVYEKPLEKSPMRLILAFVAWHVGEGYNEERPHTVIPNKQHVEQFVVRQVIELLDAPPNNPWLSSRKAGEDAEALALERFVRLYAMGPATYRPKS